jgi:hypothetical protein
VRRRSWQRRRAGRESENILGVGWIGRRRGERLNVHDRDGWKERDVHEDAVEDRRLTPMDDGRMLTKRQNHIDFLRISNDMICRGTSVRKLPFKK